MNAYEPLPAQQTLGTIVTDRGYLAVRVWPGVAIRIEQYDDVHLPIQEPINLEQLELLIEMLQTGRMALL